MSVRIREQDWTIRVVAGRQYVRHEGGPLVEVLCHCRHDAHEIVLSDRVPREGQLRLVAKAVAELAERSGERVG